MTSAIIACARPGHDREVTASGEGGPGLFLLFGRPDLPAAVPSRHSGRPARVRPVGQVGRRRLRDPRARTPDRRALDRLGVTGAIVVGHSSGGYTATALAEQRPDLVMALPLINTGPSSDALIAEEGAGAIDPVQWPHLTDAQLRQAASPGA